MLRQQSAWTVDEALTRAYLLEALRHGKTTAKLAVRRTPPQHGVQWFYNACFRHHFDGGISSAASSPDFRLQNILAATRQIDGMRISAGAVFDFNRRVRISSKLDFVDGYVIRRLLLDRDIGSGICQVSTTIWRAAYAAGLPLLERHQHSYSVAYYDPPGMEATVYAPSKNLRFRNDTAQALWLQMDWDAGSKQLSLNFFRRCTQAPRGRLSTSHQQRPRCPQRPLRTGRERQACGSEAGQWRSQRTRGANLEARTVRLWARAARC